VPAHRSTAPPEKLHRVVDGQRVVERSPGAVDVEVDVLAAPLVLQVQHLHHHPGRGSVRDLSDEKDHPIFEQQLVDGHLAGALVLDLVAGVGKRL
jgi:hypothetical protein